MYRKYQGGVLSDVIYLKALRFIIALWLGIIMNVHKSCPQVNDEGTVETNWRLKLRLLSL